MEYPAAIPGEERYVEFDEEFEMWGEFGCDSGHCYRLSCEKIEQGEGQYGEEVLKN